MSKMEVIVLVLVFYLGGIDALSCYMCPRTDGHGDSSANIECLALGWELSCAPNQDRCYSTMFADTTEVQKGCTQSQNCLGATSCCQGDFCNADPQNSQTGHGNPCNDLSDCVQGSDVMRCDKFSPEGDGKLCLCTDNSYQRGATCKRKSYPDEKCTETYECLAVNTTCIAGHCRCQLGMYPNDTVCFTQKVLGGACYYDKECAGANTMCDGVHCTCQFGYLQINGTNLCSGSSVLTPGPYAPVVTVAVFLIHLYHMLGLRK